MSKFRRQTDAALRFAEGAFRQQTYSLSAAARNFTGMLALLLCVAAQTVDGDTLKCAGVGRVRLVAIDSADKTSSVPCRDHRGNHVCDDAKAAAATAEMRTFITGKRVSYRVVGHDTLWNRPVVQAFAAGHDIQCHMLAVHQARYLPSYDKPPMIIRRCPGTVRKADR